MDYDALVRDRFFEFRSSMDGGAAKAISHDLMYYAVIGGIVFQLIWHFLAWGRLIADLAGTAAKISSNWARIVTAVTELAYIWPTTQIITWLLEHNEESGKTTVDLGMMLLYS